MSDLPSDWALVELGDIVDVMDSKRVPVNARERAKRPGDVPYYGATGQVGWIDEALFDEELVLLGEDGAPFLDPSKPKAYLINGPSWVNNHAHVLRAISEATTNRFLKYVLDAVDYRQHVNGTTRLKLTQKAMRAIPIPLPPRAEQERIVAAIEEHSSRLDAATAGTERVIGRLNTLQAHLIEAVMGSAGYLVPLDHFAAPGGITDGPFGSKLKSDHYTPSGPRVIRLENIGVGRFIEQKIHIAPEYFEELRKHEVVGGDLVVASLISDRLRACVVPLDLGPAIVKADCIRVRLKEGVDPRFLNYALMRPSLKNFVAQNMRGVGRSRLGLANVRQIPVPMAPPETQRRMADELEHALTSLTRLEVQADGALRRAGGLRRSVLAAAFSGQLIPQQPDAEPASVLLDRIRAERAAATSTDSTRKPRT